MYSNGGTLVSVVCVDEPCAFAMGHAHIIHGARRNGVVVFCAVMAVIPGFQSALQCL